jgi:hypothetical protein
VATVNSILLSNNRHHSNHTWHAGLFRLSGSIGFSLVPIFLCAPCKVLISVQCAPPLYEIDSYYKSFLSAGQRALPEPEVMKALVILWMNKPDPAQQQPVQMVKAGHISQLTLFHRYMGPQLGTKSLFRYLLPLPVTRYSLPLLCFFGKFNNRCNKKRFDFVHSLFFRQSNTL